MGDEHLDPTGAETRRLASLHALALLDGEGDPAIQALVALAAHALQCPTAMLNLVDQRRQWVLARSDPGFRETLREHAFCDVTIKRNTPLVVEDAARDPRFADNPYVKIPGGIRFYAGMPIYTLGAEGERQAIGALCVVDVVPRALSAEESDRLTHLATLAEALIAARRVALRAERQAADLTRQHRVFAHAEQMAKIGSWRLSLEDEQLEWSDGIYGIYGLERTDRPDLARALDHYPPDARARITEALAGVIEMGEPFDVECDFVTAVGDLRRVRSQGECEKLEGRCVAVIGVFQDITERHLLEKTLRRDAEVDPLTGLANRAAFDRKLHEAMTRAHRERTPLLLALMDMDGFKAINDTFGHMVGDDVLRGVGAALRADWLAGCHAARLGGDEFALIIEDPALTVDRAALAERLTKALRIPMEGGVSNGSVGVATFRDGEQSVRDFLRLADSELYAAKWARPSDAARVTRRKTG